MTVEILQRANPNLNIEVHTTVFSPRRSRLLGAAEDNRDKQTIVLATDSIQFSKKAEHVKALVALFGIHSDDNKIKQGRINDTALTLLETMVDEWDLHGNMKDAVARGKRLSSEDQTEWMRLNRKVKNAETWVRKKQ